MVINLVL